MAEHKATWSGTLMMVGQPAEEGNAGARAMLQDGLFTRFPRPGFALSFHDDDGLPSGVIGHHAGPFRSMSDAINITLYGRGGHAAMPHNTIDPVVMAAKLVLSLQTLVSRENNPVEPAVLTVSRIQAGTAGNAIPDEAQLQVSLRTYTEAQRKKLVAGIERMARAEASAAGAPKPPVIQYRSEPGKVVVNDAAITARLAKALTQALGEANVREMPRKMTSEDFAEYGAAGIPSVLLHIGAVDPAKRAEAERTGIPGPAPHSPQWLPDLAPTLRALIRAEIAAATELLPKR
jgi:hippurate hydrolase